MGRVGKTAEHHTTAEFVAFLDALVVGHDRGTEIHFIADNLSAYNTRLVSQSGRSSECDVELQRQQAPRVAAVIAVDQWLLNEFVSRRIIAILRIHSYERIVPSAQALTSGGVSVIELTLTSRGSSDALSKLRETLGTKVVIGVGTVLQAAEVNDAVSAGAQFVVSPGVRIAVAIRCAELGVPFVCGAFSPIEVADALDAGTTLIKIFPARLGGPKHLKDLAGPFPLARFIPTGGVSAQNAKAYLAAGAIAVGMGTSLVPASAVEASDWPRIEAAARQAIAAI